MNYKFAQLSLSPIRKTKNSIECFIAQPDSQREKLAGKLFLLAETDNESAQHYVSTIIDLLNHFFYQNEKVLLREKIPSIQVDHIFETALSELNKKFNEFIKEERSALRPEMFNIVAGLVHDDRVYLSASGKVRAFLIFPGKGDEQSYPFSLIDILPAESERSPETRHLLFPDIISGKLPPKSCVFIANEALPEYISEKQLTSILSSLPPSSAVEQIRNILENVNTYIPFSGIIIKNTIQERTVIETQRNQQASSNDSIAHLNRTEDMTDSLLAPSGIINISKWFKALRNSPISGWQAPKLKTPLFLKDKIFMKKRSILGRIQRLSTSFTTNIWQAILNLARTLHTSYRNRRLVIKVPANESAPTSRLAPIFAFFNGKKWLLLPLAAILIGTSLFGIMRQKDEQIQADSEKEYRELVESIKQKQNQAEASLLYNNDESAKKLFREIEETLAKLPQQSEEQKSLYAELRSKTDSQLEKIRLITRTDQAAQIADVAEANSNAKPQNIVYLPKAGRIYIADGSNRSIYILSLSDSKLTSLTELEVPITSLGEPFVPDEELEDTIYYLNGDKLTAFDTNLNDFQEVNTTIENSQAIRGVAAYNQVSYMLDTAKGDILRRTKSGNDYGAPSPWLTEKTDLSQASDIAIDGHIYILSRDGSVSKFLRGSKVSFQVGLVDPPFEAADRLSVGKSGDLYILEATKNRLVQFDKNGDFVRQYQGASLSGVSDFAVDEKAKQIYFLVGTKVLRQEMAQ